MVNTGTINNPNELLYFAASEEILITDQTNILSTISDYFKESSGNCEMKLEIVMNGRIFEPSGICRKYFKAADMAAMAVVSVYSHIITRFFPKLVDLCKEEDNASDNEGTSGITILPGFFISPLNCILSMLNLSR